MEHSKNFKKVKKIGNYVHKHNTKDFFINMVSYGRWITAEEYKEITGKDYE